jgi:hypothetical protein
MLSSIRCAMGRHRTFNMGPPDPDGLLLKQCYDCQTIIPTRPGPVRWLRRMQLVLLAGAVATILALTILAMPTQAARYPRGWWGCYYAGGVFVGHGPHAYRNRPPGCAHFFNGRGRDDTRHAGRIL